MTEKMAVKPLSQLTPYLAFSCIVFLQGAILFGMYVSSTHVSHVENTDMAVTPDLSARSRLCRRF